MHDDAIKETLGELDVKGLSDQTIQDRLLYQARMNFKFSAMGEIVRELKELHEQMKAQIEETRVKLREVETLESEVNVKLERSRLLNKKLTEVSKQIDRLGSQLKLD